MNEPKVTVVIAVEFSQKNLPDILARITGDSSGSIEVIIACTSGDDYTGLAGRYDNVITVQAAKGSRIPQMWAEGIRTAKGSLIALTTAHCIPDEDWIHKILMLDISGELAGVGGVFRNSDSASGMDWAIFLLRYRQFSTLDESRYVSEIAADNAVYRKEEILVESDLLGYGFWEPEFHARFRERGLQLMLDSSLIVVHRNCYTFWQFAAQRVEHGFAFGSARAAKMTLIQNLSLLLVSPVLPLVFLSKIVSGSFRHVEYRRMIIRSLPWLIGFIACWGYGECKGYFFKFFNCKAR